MEKLTRLTAEHRDNFAAYLDGELDDTLTRHIETVLSQSNVARNDVEMLAKTYELLDLLPRPKASGEFSEKTLAIARLKDSRTDFLQSPTYRRLQRAVRWTGWAAILFSASALSYSVARYRAPVEDDLLLDDLNVIRQYDAYKEAGGIEFLNRLGLENSLIENMNAESSRANQ